MFLFLLVTVARSPLGSICSLSGAIIQDAMMPTIDSSILLWMYFEFFHSFAIVNRMALNNLFELKLVKVSFVAYHHTILTDLCRNTESSQLSCTVIYRYSSLLGTNYFKSLRFKRFLRVLSHTVLLSQTGVIACLSSGHLSATNCGLNS